MIVSVPAPAVKANPTDSAQKGQGGQRKLPAFKLSINPKIWKTGRKIATKETQEGCLSFSINRFSELFEVLKNASSLSKKSFRQAEGGQLSLPAL
ncbi:hypothetical protein [uncultured Oscillibacter sp.]|uniref:hypothetical protein n=1 Tax=uncultured Oscillibacter sp. TaxID=876091 RepID=UPI00260800D8|nr:hypothetical protein [uncultured Oscillibacter sp.]